ncbi:MAG: glycosyltransferase family 4 protein [candidate division Zixibacteria bacterium]|nr:glycosyltransferase family 4 protein [candidate division Zixibacteria bacterium]
MPALKPIRVLILTHNYPRFDGDFSGIFLSLLTKQILEHGITPIVLAPHDAGLPIMETIDGIKIYRFRYASNSQETLAYRGNMQNAMKSLAGIIKFRQFLNAFEIEARVVIESEKIDLIAGHWLIPAGIVMKRLAKSTPLPMILSSHGTDIRLSKKYPFLFTQYFRSLTHRLYRWTVVSRFLADELTKIDHALSKILTTLPLPHDEKLFYRDTSIKKDGNLIVSITRFTEQKRVNILLKAFAMVHRKNPTARLEIYGTGELQVQIETDIIRSELAGAVTIHPPVAQKLLRDIYSRSAVVVLNSFQEGFGLALSEAMLCGTAVIGTDSGGIPDIIEHNRTGLLVPVDDAAKLAEAMILLLENVPLRNRLVESGHETAMEKYASANLTAKYSEIIKGAVQFSQEQSGRRT